MRNTVLIRETDRVCALLHRVTVPLPLLRAGDEAGVRVAQEERERCSDIVLENTSLHPQELRISFRIVREAADRIIASGQKIIGTRAVLSHK